eukprot:jgi/Ulvmu1/236/UM001_0240.1
MKSLGSGRTHHTLSLLEDLISGQNDWRNISDVVRTTFRAFHDVIKRHSTALSTLTKVVDEKASQHDVNCALESSATEVCGRLQEVERGLERLPDRQLDDEAAWRREMAAAKADTIEVHRLLESKACVAHVKEALAQKADRRLVQSLRAAQEQQGSVEDKLALLERDLHRKAALQDVCKMMEAKASCNEVEAALRKLSSDVAGRADVGELRRALERQDFVNRGLSADRSLGRWMWKSGKCISGKGVPWNVQNMNSAPENFIWEKDKPTVVVVEAGIYELSFGIYAKSKPAVQVIVNGQVILCALNNNSYVTPHHSAGRLTTAGSLGAVTGLTGLEFLSLPGRAKVSVRCSSDEKAEGFLSLKHL